MGGNIKLYPAVIALYTELYKQVTVKSSRHTYAPSAKNKILICKFIGWLNSNYNQNQLGIDFLINYFEFQFNRYIGINVQGFGRNAVDLAWLVGPKAITVWQQRNPNKKKFIKYRISRELRLQLVKAFAGQKQVIVNSMHRQMLLNANAVEEFEKQRYYNTKIGYLHCANMTTLYNPVSSVCQNCVFKTICLERLQNNYPNLYKLRMTNT